MDQNKEINYSKIDGAETEVIANKKELKERLIDLKVNLVNVHKMPIHGHIILPDSSKQRFKLWRQLHLPFIFNFHERRLKKYGG